MKIAILGKKDTWYTSALQSAFRNKNIEVPCFPISSLTASVGTGKYLSSSENSLEGFDVLLVRAIPSGSLEQVIYRMDALHRLENLGVRVINSAETIERGVDKYYTLTRMEDLGIKVPETIVTERFEDAVAAFEELRRDVIVKPLFGSEGKGMVRVTDKDAAYRLFRAIEMGKYIFYIQRYIPHGNRDYRVFVIGGRVAAAMIRRGKDWKCNIANGADAEPFMPDSVISDISIKAAEVLKADYAGVDIMPGEDGNNYLIEVNSIPGWRGLEKATGFNAASHIVDYVLKKYIS
ncbi:MAG: RimK family alpha-L-glutamate ligase [Desulfatiglans sp.]|jgi:RimK family alpha-L-glutamate ligase|nr:RimK family alpha-L-glutamate ligase [Desulfatiglans sp.]